MATGFSARYPDLEQIHKYVSEGGVLPPGYVLPPLPDKSNLDNLDRVIKAIGLVIAEVSGRTPAQIRTIFKDKYDTLS